MTALPSYIGACCREWIMAYGYNRGTCGFCGEHPTYVRHYSDGPGHDPEADA